MGPSTYFSKYTCLGADVSVNLFPLILEGSLSSLLFKDPLRIDGYKLTDTFLLCHLMDS